MILWGLLGILGGVITILVLILRWRKKVYNDGFKIGFKEGQESVLHDAAESNRELFEALYHNLDNPNNLFLLKHGKRPKPD